ncbi:MAG: hypothetical protein GY858_01145 [Candidatus Omnitrophica bacterium]|nr:hypothetical protein [Candidatus Omnitrophota bacterium]
MKNKIEIDKKIESFELIKPKRTKWEGMWEDIRKYAIPEDPKGQVFDSTARWAREQLSSGLQGLLVNRSSAWFSVSVSKTVLETTRNEEEDINNDPEVIKWCSSVNQGLLDIFHNDRSNFYSQINLFFLTLTAFGTAVFFVEADSSLSSGMFFRNIDLNECYFEDNRLGFVDRMFRKFNLTARIASQQFPDEKELKEKAKKTPDEEIEILHVVEEVLENKKKKFRYSSDYIDLGGQKILQSGGYDYFPFLVCRWMKEKDAWGYSPANTVLPDIKTLNIFQKMWLQAGQKKLQPTLAGPKDGYLFPLKLGAGDFNPHRNGLQEKIYAIHDVGDLQADGLLRSETSVLRAYYIDIFKMQKETKEMTATEVNYRTEEQMRMLSPMVGNIETELLTPLIKVTYAIALGFGLLPGLDIPGKQTTDLGIDYISPLSRSQKSTAITAIEQVLGFFQRTGISNIYPEIYDNINFDQVLRESFTLRGAPQSVLRNEKEVTQIREQRSRAIREEEGPPQEEMSKGTDLGVLE